jgi:hypothetical protein
MQDRGTRNKVGKMVLQASDELRHPIGTEPAWRESLYFNFNDPATQIGGWVYLWVVPHRQQASGMLVSFYHGAWPDPGVIDAAAAAPGHRIEAGDRWVYCFQGGTEALLADDFDDVSLCGLNLRRIEPLKHYALSFDDGDGNGFDFDCRFLTLPFDYADGANPTPPWLAKNRYHRAHKIAGELRIAGKSYAIDCTGDSDHSWGLRDMDAFGSNRFKMWSLQSSDGRLSLSVLQQGVDDRDVALGFVSVDGVMASARSVESHTRFDRHGVQHDFTLNIEDDLGRVIRASFGAMHSLIGWDTDNHFWGFEGVGDYEVEGYGRAPGLCSYFWPAKVTPDALHAGQWD